LIDLGFQTKTKGAGMDPYSGKIMNLAVRKQKGETVRKFKK